jgi:hypothetical protein
MPIGDDGHPGRVFMATLSNGHDLSPRFAKSKHDLDVYDREFAMYAWSQMGEPESPTPVELRLLHTDLFVESGVNVSNRRNKACQQFLETPDVEWLWFVDSDQVFEPDTLHRMVVTASANDVKILGALIPIVGPTGLISNLYVDHEEAITHVVLNPFMEHFGPPGPKEFAATGAGCLLIHRDVLEAIHKDQGDHISYFYEDRRYSPSGERRWMGEDITFCLQARELGFPVIVDTSIHVGHHKDVRTWWPEEIPDHMADPDAVTYGAQDGRKKKPAVEELTY